MQINPSKKLKLEANDQVVFIQRGNEIILKPLRNIFTLRGIVQQKNGINFNDLRDSVRNKVVTNIGSIQF